MKHEGSACFKGCLDDVWPITALTEISLSTCYHESLQSVSQYTIYKYSTCGFIWPTVMFLCVFSEQLQKVTIKIVRSVHPSIPQQGTGQFSPDGFSWNFTFGIIKELKLDKITHTLHEDLHMVTISCQWQILIQRMVQPSNYSPTRHDWPVFASLSLNDWSSELRQTVRCDLL